jgi:signal peptidase I
VRYDGPVASCRKTSIACDSAAFAELSVAILAMGKALRFRARGHSMHPLVRDGDLLLIQPISAGAIRRGDLVFFRNPRGEMVVHRMLRRANRSDTSSFEVKGDGLAGPDGLVTAPQIFGRVSSIERDGVCIDLRQPGMRLLGFVLALMAPLGPNSIRSVPWLKALIQRAPLVSRYLE